MKKFNLLLVISILIIFSIPIFAETSTNTYTVEELTKEIAKCAAIKGDLERLEAYDSLSRLLGVAYPRVIYPDVKGTGKWISNKKINPIDDTPTVKFILRSDSGKSTYGGSIYLKLRYYNGKTDVIIDWDSIVGNMLSGEVEVLTRIGDEKAITLNWGGSTDYKATFYPGNSVEFIRKLMNTDKLVAQATPYFENPITAIFDIRGLKDAIEQFNDTLHWIKD